MNEVEESGLLRAGDDEAPVRNIQSVAGGNSAGKQGRRLYLAAVGAVFLAACAILAYASSHASGTVATREPVPAGMRLVLAEKKEEEEKEEKEEKEDEDACSKPGWNCKDTKCCAWGGMQCYEKDEKYATCRNSCTAGPDFRDMKSSDKWTCKELGKRNPGKGIDDKPIEKLPDWVKEKCAKPGANCLDSECCAWGGQQCFEKSEKYGNCKNWCTPGPDFYDADSSPWSCISHGPKTPGKGVNPPMLVYEKLPKWFHKTCSKDGEDCSKSQCCISKGTQCYQKKEGWSVCMASCAPGPQWFEKGPEPWTCKKFGPRTPGVAAAPPVISNYDALPTWVATECAKATKDCSKVMCCADPGMQCYQKEEGWATCKPRCVPGPDPSDNNKEWNCKALGPRTPIKCPACAPKVATHPDVIIPFFERDLCKLKYTAKSLSVNDPDHILGKIHLMWISMKPSSMYQADLDEIKADITKTHEYSFRDFNPQLMTSTISGWHAQQVLKLKMASEVGTDYYIVMDSKNTMIRPLKLDMFFTPCNQAIIQAEFPWYKIPVPHSDWYGRSAAALGVAKPSSGMWPASITPIIMHKQTVLNMLAKLGEGHNTGKFCDGSLCQKIGAMSDSGHGATEFTLYTLMAYENPTGKTPMKCIHSVEEMQHFKITYSPKWQDELNKKLAQSDFPTDKKQVTVSDDRGYPLDWDPSITSWTPPQSSFPLKFEDLTKKWAASLWRGTAVDKDKLVVVNQHTLRDTVNGVRQFPLMFGAQPAAMKAMPPEVHTECLNNLLKIYEKANLYYGDAAGLEACVVGYKN